MCSATVNFTCPVFGHRKGLVRQRQGPRPPTPRGPLWRSVLPDEPSSLLQDGEGTVAGISPAHQEPFVLEAAQQKAPPAPRIHAKRWRAGGRRRSSEGSGCPCPRVVPERKVQQCEMCQETPTFFWRVDSRKGAFKHGLSTCYSFLMTHGRAISHMLVWHLLSTIQTCWLSFDLIRSTWIKVSLILQLEKKLI